MRIGKIGMFAIALLLGAACLPTALFSATICYDSNGKAIENRGYDLIVVDRDKAIASELQFGYTPEGKFWKDPIKLRKKRIEQWRKLRLLYDPDSLPSKIEPNAVRR